MKKITVALFALIFLCVSGNFAFSQAAETKINKKTEACCETIKGKIISIDTVKNEVVVKNNKTGVEKTIAVDPKVISSLNKEENVRIRVKKGSNVAESVKQLVKVAAPAKNPAK